VSKNVAMFVDVANMYYAARGQDVDVDYVALLKHATKGRDLIRAYAYTGLDPENENQRKFIDFLGKNGYKPVVKDIRKFGDGRMKANLDIELVVDLFRLADRMDIAVIVSGDGDFAPAIRALQDKGVRAEVISFKPNTSSDLIAVADEFQDIMKIASISRKEGRAIRDSMSTPEMPAKEVNPEFGFREASPAVAAAALAALKGGGPPARGGRAATSRRSSSSAAAAATEAPDRVPATPSAAEAIAESDEAARRRRRRRGGRGRGRGRRDDETTETEGIVGGDGEIGWEELDDLSQIDGLGEDREYGFTEADSETLAELGLTEEELAELTVGVAPEALDAAPGTGTATSETEEKPKRRRSTRAATSTDEKPTAEDGPGEEKPRRRRSTRTAKADDDASAVSAAAPDAPDAVDAADAKPTRRRSTRRAKEDEGAAAGAGEASEKPARRRSTRAPKADDAGESTTASAVPTDSTRGGGDAGGEEPQGIWGRFRAARGRRPATGS
jgi:uncharacterized LabA/DUF88 family protein